MLTENEMLQSMRFRSEVSLQITLDQDYNIPDNKADMEKMVVENGEVQIQNVKVMQDKMIVKGLRHKLYTATSDLRRIHTEKTKRLQNSLQVFF